MTFTLIARNPYTRQLGLAMASGADDCVGSSLVAAPLAGGNPALIVVQGKKGDAAMHSALAAAWAGGQLPAQMFEDLARQDSALPLRQVMMAAFDAPLLVETGKFCAPWAGHHAEEHLMAAGNMLASSSVLARMRKAYMADLHAPMRKRLLMAVQAGMAAGGDLRGHASAGIVIAGEQPFRCVITGSRQPFDDLQTAMAGAGA